MKRKKNETYDTQTIRMVADILGRSALLPGNSNSRVGFVLCPDLGAVDHGGDTMILAMIIIILALALGCLLGAISRAKAMSEYYHVLCALRITAKQRIQ